MKYNVRNSAREVFISVQEYWQFPLSTIPDSTKIQNIHPMVTILIGLFVFFLFQFFPDWSISKIVSETLIIMLVFGVSHFVMDCWLIPQISKVLGRSNERTVGKIWIISFLGFVLGYLLYRLPTILGFSTGKGIIELFLKILPIWFAVTFIILQVTLKRILRTELNQLQKINQFLAQRSQSNPSPSQARTPKAVSAIANSSPDHSVAKLLVNIGETVEVLKMKEIVFISSEEHYAQIKVNTSQGVKLLQARMVLREVLVQLPAQYFIQIHRSHIVNMFYVQKIERMGSGYQLRLENHAETFPISRYRASHVLPQLQQFLSHLSKDSLLS